jgi:xanthine dehydrogenase accessory factor
MHSTDLSVLNTAIAWLTANHRVAIVTVTKTWGSSPRPIGSWLAIRDDGQVIGSVSGGCVEDDLIRRVQDEIFSKDLPETVIYGVSQDEAARFGLPCGGTLKLLVEPKPELAVLKQILQLSSNHHMVRRTLDLSNGLSQIEKTNNEDVFFCDDRFMKTTYGPRWRMVIIGAGHLSICTAELALAADFEVIIIDPRAEYVEGVQNHQIRLFKGMPDDILQELNVDSHTAVVALSHDPKLDDMALMEALKSPAFYVGALGSRLNTKKRKERLLQLDVSKEEADRLYGPIGLYIGAQTPPEIAISILAEIISLKYGITPPPKE